jgi:WD40 repeat protein/serine/threonine protein kinase
MSSNLRERLRGIDERCGRYEADWRARRKPRIEDYLEGVEEATQRRTLWLELVLLDLVLRREAGEDPTLEDDWLRDPDRAVLLELSTDLLAPSPPDGGPALAAGAADLRPAREAKPGAEGRSGDVGLDLQARLRPAPELDDPDEVRTAAEDLPSTIGDDRDRPGPDHDETVGEGLPSTAWASPEDRAGLDEPSATEGWGADEHPPEPVPLPPGLVLGDYELIARLAQGGMGVVYKARQKSLNRIVALKTIKAGALASERELRLFQIEAEAIAALDHPGIVPILEVGEQGGMRYYSMKLIEGLNLHQCRKRFRGQPRAIAHLVAQVARAIHHAHLRGVLHRDLKPSNILIDAPGEPHVVDWGLAKRLEVEGDLSSVGGVAGTPCYMAPEQAQGRREAITTATDVYGLGTILYVLLTQKPPFRAETTMQTLRLVIEREPKRPRAVDPRIDADLETICLKCLEKEPKRRYASAGELADDLERRLAGEPILARPVSSTERILKWAGRHPAVSGLSGLSILAILAGLAGFIWEYGQAVEAREGLRAALSLSRQNETQALRSEDAALRLAYAAKLNLAARDWTDANTEHLQQVLEETRPQPGGKDDLRGFEWYYLQRLCHLDRWTFSGHGGPVWDVAFSPDGKLLASASMKGVWIWEAASGHLIRILPVQGDAMAVAFHPDGKRLITGGTGRTLTLWDTVSGQVLRTLQGHAERVLQVVFNADGTRIASSSHDGTFRTWETETGRLAQTVRVFDESEQTAPRVAFSPDGRRLVTTSKPAGIKVWDVASGTALHGFSSGDRLTPVVALSPDGRSLASSSDTSLIKVWDLAAGKVVQIFKGPRSSGSSLIFSPDGRTLASASLDQMVTLWDTATGQALRTFRGHTAGIQGIVFSPDGKLLASASSDKSVKLWDVTRDQESRPLRGHDDVIMGVVFSPDGRSLASASADRTIKLWDLASGQVTRTFSGSSAAVRLVRFSPDGKSLASGGVDPTVKLWDVATGRELRTLRGHTKGVSGVAFGPDGTWLASASEDRSIWIWDSAKGTQLRSLEGHIDPLVDLAISPDGKTLVSSGGDGFVKFWDVQTGHVVKSINPDEYLARAVALRPDGAMIATAGTDRTIKVWDVATAQLIGRLRGHADNVWALAFSPDGRRLASVSPDESVRIWDPADGQELATLPGNAGALWAVSFSPDGRRLAAAGSGREIRLWEAPDAPAPTRQPATPPRQDAARQDSAFP